jgi:EAL domain-containing protein (putative c-di-GMP-specific phosphodiesterase class I)/GGDEF domain-containing protein
VDQARARTRGVRHRSGGVLPLNAAATGTAALSAHGLSYPDLVAAVSQAIEGAAGSLAVLLVGVTDLPAVQARLGFQHSAALLEIVAERFRGALRERGTVLRFGEGGFCVLVSAVRNAGHAVLAAEKLRHTLEEVMADAALGIAPQFHLGIALCPRHAPDAEGLLRKAQLAAAAARKRTAFHQVYDDSCSEQVLTPWTLGEAYIEALRSGALEVHYQPKVQIGDNRTAGVEALMRWIEDGRVVASPDVFIPLAETAGLIEETTWYALSNSLRLAAGHAGLGVAVNITPAMLHHHDFMEMVRTAVSSWSLQPGSLTLEITEGALIVDFEEAISRFGQMRELGVRVSIDDFGTGYSSLSYFKKISADEIKIDKSFVMRMLSDKADQHLVDAMIRLAHQFGFNVVAEGVEDQETLEALARMGCDCAQGHLFAPALSASALALWLQRRT